MAEKKAAAKKPAAKKPVYESQESLYAKAVIKMNEDAVIVQHAYKAENYRRAAAMFELVGDYEDAAELAQQCYRLADETEEEERVLRYGKAREKEEKALESKEGAGYEYGKAAELYEGLGDYRDSAQRAKACADKKASIDRKGRLKHTAVLTALGLLVLGAVLFVLSGMFTYTIGRIYEKANWEDNAIASYEKVGTLLDAEERIAGIQARKDARARHNNYVNLAEGAPGKECWFGTYKWLILDRQGDYALMLLTNFVIAEHQDLWQIPYNTEQTDVTWLDSSLRAYLNSEILENDFTDAERARLMPISAETTLQHLPAESGETDYVSLLTWTEMNRYKKLMNKLGGVDYWLRTAGTAPGTAVVFSAMDRVFREGMPVTTAQIAVRPIILVNTAGIMDEEEA